MSRNFRSLIPAVTATTVVVLLTVGYEAARVVLGECDAKLGCSGGIWFALLLSGVASLISFFALVFVAATRANKLAQLSFPSLLFIGLIEGLALTVLLRTVFYWSLDLPTLAGVWALLTAAIGLVLISLAGRGRPAVRGAQRADT